VILAYANAEMQGRDSSVELYLLNNWVKQLRLRDLIGRCAEANQVNKEAFITIFSWLMMHSLNGNNEEQWQMEDFRKLAIPLASNTNH